MIYLEDFAPGQKYVSATLPVDAAAIKAFAAQFDPARFHLDEDAARGSFFAGSSQAAGIPPHSRCGRWSAAGSAPPAESSAHAPKS